MARAKGDGQTIKTQVEADNATPGQYQIGDGLFLKVIEKSGNSYGSYVQRIQHQGRRHDIAIGSRNKVKLALAKQLAAKARIAVIAGNDPKAAIGQKTIDHGGKDFRLAAVVDRKFESLKHSLKGQGASGRWLSPLNVHVLPKLGQTSVSEIDTNVIQRTLAPIWQRKPEVAIKAYNRLKMCLEFADDEGAQVVLGAAEKAKRLLGDRVHQVTHIPATPYSEVPDLYLRLCQLDQSSAVLALRLAILTAQRLSPVRWAQIDQFDMKDAIWTIPGANLKGRLNRTEDFRCPLSSEAMTVVSIANAQMRGDMLFPAQRGGGVASDRGIEKVLDRLKEEGRPHGFRSGFGDWAAATDVPFDLAERCLQHSFGSKVARAYRRDDQLPRRAQIMNDWSSHVVSARDAVDRPSLRVVE